MSIKNTLQLQEYLYDFSVDGGSSVAAIDLSAKAGYNPLPTGAVVEKVIGRVITAVTGATSVQVGTTYDADYYSDRLIADYAINASLAINSTPFYVAGSATGAFVVRFPAADATAGKILYGVHYWMPSL